MVDSLDQPEVFMELIEKNIRTHINRKIGVEQYKRLKVSFVDTLLAVLGSEVMNKDTVIAWEKAFDVIVDTYNRISNEKKWADHNADDERKTSQHNYNQFKCQMDPAN